MPPKTRLSGSALSPYSAHFTDLDNTVEEIPGGVGSLLVIGLDDADSDSGCEESYTQEEMLGLRHIILTENREVDLAKALEFVTSEESGSLGQFIATNATAVINTLEAEVENAMDKTTVQAQFDALVTLTYAITIYDHWLYSVTSSNKTKKLNAALLKLANYWACILEHDTPNLGIDEIDKYTLPGTLALLKKLEDKCRGGSDCAFSVNTK